MADPNFYWSRHGSVFGGQTQLGMSDYYTAAQPSRKTGMKLIRITWLFVVSKILYCILSYWQSVTCELSNCPMQKQTSDTITLKISHRRVAWCLDTIIQPLSILWSSTLSCCTIAHPYQWENISWVGCECGAQLLRWCSDTRGDIGSCVDTIAAAALRSGLLCTTPASTVNTHTHTRQHSVSHSHRYSY